MSEPAVRERRNLLPVLTVYSVIFYGIWAVWALLIRPAYRNAFGETLLPYTIRVSKDVEESTLAQVPILDYAPRAAVTGDYIALADYIAATDKAACRAAYVQAKA